MLNLFLALAFGMPVPQSVSPPELTPLMRAAADDDLKRTHLLLAHGANVNEKAKGGQTALYEAIERRKFDRDNLPLVDALLHAGADPNEPAIFHLSPLMLSLTRTYANSAVTLRLLQGGAHVSRECDGADSLLSLATQDSSVEVMLALLQRGAAVNCQSSGGQTALHWAAMNGEFDRVVLLLRFGANQDLQDSDGRTPLDVAVIETADKRIQANFLRVRQALQETRENH